MQIPRSKPESAHTFYCCLQNDWVMAVHYIYNNTAKIFNCYVKKNYNCTVITTTGIKKKQVNKNKTSTFLWVKVCENWAAPRCFA